MSLQVRADFSHWRQGCAGMQRSVYAVRETVSGKAVGRGEVYTKMRKKLRGEKSAALHGRAIANILADKGHPVDVPLDEDVSRVEHILEKRVDGYMRRAAALGVPLTGDVNRTLAALAEVVRDSMVERVSDGGAGRNTQRYGRRKAAQLARGAWWVTDEFGSQPIYGVKSGRYLRGLSSRLGRGPRGRSTVY